MRRKKFFCIRGHMKSGTNWVCRLINLHPDIDCKGEYHWHNFVHTYEQNNRRFVNLGRTENNDPVIRRNLREFCKNSMIERSKPSARFIGDRTPHTIRPVIVAGTPHIVVIRDCRDVLVSKMFHMFNTPKISTYFDREPEMKALKEKFEKNPWFFQENPEQLLTNEEFVRQTCQSWADYMKSDRAVIERQKKLPVKQVKYESLHRNVEGLRYQLYEFIGADPALAEPIPDNLLPGHSKENPNQFNRKGVIGDWQNYVTEEVKQWINEEAGEELIKQGYVADLDWEIGDVQGNRRIPAAAKDSAVAEKVVATKPEQKVKVAAGSGKNRPGKANENRVAQNRPNNQNRPAQRPNQPKRKTA